jgi:hypothetical protein
MMPANRFDNIGWKSRVGERLGPNFAMAAPRQAHLYFDERTATSGETTEPLSECGRHAGEGQPADIVDQTGQEGLTRIYLGAARQGNIWAVCATSRL